MLSFFVFYLPVTLTKTCYETAVEKNYKKKKNDNHKRIKAIHFFSSYISDSTLRTHMHTHEVLLQSLLTGKKEKKFTCLN